MGKLALSLSALTVSILAMLIGCQSADDGRVPACSQGTPYAPFTNFPLRSGGDADECKQRCGYNGVVSSGGGYNVDALPTGACDVEGYTCRMAIYDFCKTNGMRCECTNGNWSCYLSNPGASACIGDRECVVAQNGLQSCQLIPDAGTD